MAKQPFNLMVICLDSFRHDLFEHTAPWSVQLPNLDRLRSESVRFTNAFGEGLPTIPMRRAFFTGQRSFPWRYEFDTKGMFPTGRGWHQIPPEQPTLAELLLEQGYQTGFVGDTYHMFKSSTNYMRGFLHYEFIRGLESDTYRGGKISIEDLLPYTHETSLEKNLILSQYLLNKGKPQHEEDHPTAQTFLTAIRWLKDHKESAPFFLWVDSFGPHEPWDPPRKYVKPYVSNPEYRGIEAIFPIGYKDVDLTRDEENRVRELYFGYLSFVDHWLGQLIDTMKEQGLYDNTIIMVTSDHGTELMDHGQFSKSAARLYTHNTQFIWTIRHPEYDPCTFDGFVQSQDLFPTALGLLGIEHEAVAGDNVWNWVTKEEIDGRNYVICGWSQWASIRTREWNYWVNFENPNGHEYLFHLVHDPTEHQNLADQKPEICITFRHILETFLGQKLPVHLPDVVEPSEAPIVTHYKANLHSASPAS